MRISYCSPSWLGHRHERGWRGRSRSLLCLPVLAVALLAFILPQAANAAEWRASQFESEETRTWRESGFESTDCTTTVPTRCVAVGWFWNGFDEEHLPLVAQGTTEYKRDPFVPSPSSEDPVLKAVSCNDPIAKSCHAVGSYGPTGKRRPFAESATTESAGLLEWKLETVPSPTGAVSAELTGVSCVHATGGETCTAVGKWEASTKVRSIFAEQWKSESGWKLQTIVNPTEVSEIPEASVSCAVLSTGVVKCEMAGDYIKTSKAKLVFAESWNGTAWSLQSIPTPAKASDLAVSGASCAQAGPFECTMVGGWGEEVGETVVAKTLAARWNGTEWKIQESKNSPGAENFLTGVSCLSGKVCFAVGRVGTANSAAAEYWNGTAWEIQKTAQPTAELLAVSCRGGRENPNCGSAGRHLQSSDFGESHTAYAEHYE
jgi:hypothetical protein